MFLLAKKLNKISIWLFYLAAATFLLAGTALVLQEGGSPAWLELTFTHVPVWLVFFSVLPSTLCGWLLVRLGVVDRKFTAFVFMLCFVATVGFKLFGLSSWIAAGAWVGVAYMLKANVKRFEAFVRQKESA